MSNRARAATHEQFRAERADVVEGEGILWAPSPVTVRGVTALPVGVTGACVLGWGDGATADTAGGAPPVSHTYAHPGSYMLTVHQDDTLVAQQQIVVRDGLAPAVGFAADPANPNMIIATVNDQPARVVSEYTITWEDGAEYTGYLPNGATVKHGFRAGTYPVVVRDLHTRRVLRQDVEVKDKEYDPDFTFAQGTDTMTVEVTLSKLASTGKDVLVDWGDGEQTTLSAPAVGDKTSHTYQDADSYIVQCVYTDGSTEGSAALVTVPFAAS